MKARVSDSILMCSVHSGVIAFAFERCNRAHSPHFKTLFAFMFSKTAAVSNGPCTSVIELRTAGRMAPRDSLAPRGMCLSPTAKLRQAGCVFGVVWILQGTAFAASYLPIGGPSRTSAGGGIAMGSATLDQVQVRGRGE